MEKWEIAHKKRETPSANQLSSFLSFASFFSVLFYGSPSDVRFSFALNALVGKCEIAVDRRNNTCLEWSRVQQIYKFYHDFLYF